MVRLNGQLKRSHLCSYFPTVRRTYLLNKYTHHQQHHDKILRRHLLTLAIETSCDDTCVAILESDSHNAAPTDRQYSSLDATVSSNADSRESHSTGKSDSLSTDRQARLLFNEKITARNTGHGGIHPLEALDSHRANLAKLVERAILSLPVVRTPRKMSPPSQPTTATKTKAAEVIDEPNALNNPEGKENKIFQCHDGQVRKRPDLIAVTRGPGMRSNLSCGLETAKGLAVAWQVPFVGVHHMQAHALTPRLVNALDGSQSRQPAFPFLTLLVSGGHTMLLHSMGLTDHQILASTADIAIGDALDKCGRLLLPEQTKSMAKDTAFAKYLSEHAFPDQSSFNSWPLAARRRDELAKPLNEFGWQMQTPFSNSRDATFSFASIASRTESILRERQLALGRPINDEENIMLARTAIGTAFEHLASRTIMALEELRRTQTDIGSLVVSGGVAANDFLRFYLRAMLTARGFDGVRLIFPPIEYCTDNAAMIAWAGAEMYESGYSSDLGIDALRKWSMDGDHSEGGILCVRGWKHQGLSVDL